MAIFRLSACCRNTTNKEIILCEEEITTEITIEMKTGTDDVQVQITDAKIIIAAKEETKEVTVHALTDAAAKVLTAAVSGRF